MVGLNKGVLRTFRAIGGNACSCYRRIRLTPVYGSSFKLNHYRITDAKKGGVLRPPFFSWF